MKFILKTLKIRNFKGLREQDIDFHPIATTICGENGTGKTTVVDAFAWLLFEKDSKGRAQFEIKTLEDGEQIHGLDHTVEGHFKIDGRPLKLKKTFKEVWTKKRGEDQPTFSGHEIVRVINDIPVKKSEYENKIGKLVDEKIFHLLTDPHYFSQQLSWKERRGTLFSLTGGDITNENVFLANPSLRAIEEDLEDKTIEELKKSLSYQRRELNKQRENIPVKIETLSGTIKEIDKTAIEFRCKFIRGGIKATEEQMLDATKLGEEQIKKQDELYKLRTRQKEIEYEAQNNIKDPDEEVKQKIKALQNKLTELKPQANSQIRAIGSLEKSIERGSKELDRLRARYQEEAAKEITVDDSIKACPTCKRPFPEDEVEDKVYELVENFNANKVKELKRLREEGQSMGQEVKELQEELESGKKELDQIQDEMETQYTEIRNLEGKLGTKPKKDIGIVLQDNEEYQIVRAKIEKLEAEVRNMNHNETLKELKAKKEKMELELKEVEKDLHQEEINQETKEKIKALMEEEKILSKQISEIEQKEHVADQFINTKAELIEKSINEKFEKVSFRLFKKQINGALDETCDVLVDGVPFDNANTAGQVNGGLDVINSLCRHYDTYTPIFIDNSESINNFEPSDSQMIKLKVTKHKGLVVKCEEN